MTRESKRIFAAALVALLAVPSFAEPADAELDLAEPSLGLFGAGNVPEAFVPYSSAATAVGAEAKNDVGTTVNYVLNGYEVGGTVSEQGRDYYIGQYCDRFPVPEERIDWTATLAAIIASEGYRQGAVTVNPSMADPTKRILFTRGGRSTSIEWHFTDEDGQAAVQTDVYQVSEVSDRRPHRLYWTEAPFDAPGVSLSGKFVKLFGAPEIIGCETATDAVSKVERVVRGIWFDRDSKTLRVAAKATAGGYDGPRGQFVLAYYKSGDCQPKDFVCATVVEVSEPKQTELSAEVGDELFPSGDGWSIEGLHAKVSKGAVKDEDDPNSPYAEVFEHTDAKTRQKVTSVYAVTPTDGASLGTGMDAPWKIDIYWQSPDEMDTLWPFERAWYKVTWPETPRRMVYDAAGLGQGILVPTNYTGALCDYQAPRGTAALNGREVKAARDGWFTLKLSVGTEQVFYLPFRATSNTDGAVLNSNAVRRVRVGVEITPTSNEQTGGTAEASYRAVDPRQPGYIYAPGSKGRNWNARLYHDLAVPADVDTSAGDAVTAATDEGASDPFASLVSSIYAVSASVEPIEVWWRGSALPVSHRYAAPAALPYPTCVQRVVADWPEPNQVPEIVLASQLGSDGLSLVKGGKAIYFMTPDDSLSLASGELPLYGGDCTFGFWVNVQPAEDVLPARADGRIVTLCHRRGDESGESGTFALDLVDNAFSVHALGTNVVFAAPTNEWVYLSVAVWSFGEGEEMVRALSFDYATLDEINDDMPHDLTVPLTEEEYAALAGGAITNLTFGKAGEGAKAALGVAFDDFYLARCQFGSVLDVFEGDVAEGELAFDDAADGQLKFFDWDSFILMNATDGIRLMSPGAPKLTSGRVPGDGGVVPEVYRQSDENLPGYHLNLAHAFTATDSGNADFTTWALRTDQGRPLRDGLVFTMYAENGKGRMRTYSVAVTNAVYHDFSSSVTVGKQMLPPKPLQLLDGYWNDGTTWTAVNANSGEDKTIVYRDRKLNDWAKRDGGGYAFYHYKVREDFDWLKGAANAVPVGSYTPWLKGLGWYWSAVWPLPETVPTMRVAQTLTKAQAGLPEVWNMASCAVVYPNPNAVSNIVDLIDPVTAQCVPLLVVNDFPSEYGFTVGNSGTTMMRDGKYYFTGLPPSVSDRFYYDPNAVKGQELQLIGKLIEPATGNPYLQLNVLTAEETAELKGICKLPVENTRKKIWDEAIDRLAAMRPIKPSSLSPVAAEWKVTLPNDGTPRFVTNELTRLQSKAAGTNVVVSKVMELCQAENARPAYVPVSNYALMANGNDAGYVTIVENDNPDTSVVSEGLPVNVQVIRVLPELYAGTIRPLADPLNKLSEMLTIQYNEPFGAASENFTFQWRRLGPNADGTVNTHYDEWPVYRTGAGLTSFVLGKNGTQLTELVNKYYVMRYWANAGTLAYETVDGRESAFTDHTLAEGWVQRVLNALTPFTQRVEDFYSNPSDLWYTMFEQIGRPYRGDVALNNANLTEVGLLELYQTIFNKAEKMSIANGVKDLDVNKQLLLAASRIADFYMLLGAEAYADAKNPLVEQKSIDGLEASALALPSSTFCFQNQVRTLLDEELALLRGRTCANQPNMTTQPIYNRLIWNFTKGITEGEVAYVNNYGIRATDGVLTVDQAAKQYPQGHGDAWGHYLSAITGYYRLLRNPNFGWEASMMEMMISQSVVNNDDTDEQKFADAALKLAQTGLDAMDLTARKAWRDNAGDPMAAYGDGASVTYEKGAEKLTVREGFGYGQWAVRAGLGGIYNWAVVNSLLPTNAEPAAVYADKGLRQITRATATQLASLCDTVNAIQQKVNTLDAGLNPLGLDQDAIPMDIDPDELAAKNSHFDQLLARTERALENCGTVLDFANRYGARLKQIQNAETDAIAEAEAQEREYDKQLIELYGKPYAGDIGPGGLYVQGYNGPDLYHYMLMDTATYGIKANDPLGGYADRSYTYYVQTGKGNKAGLNADQTGKVAVHFEFDKSGILRLPSNMGSRAYEGRLQDAYRTYLSALSDYNAAVSSYNLAMENFKTELSYIVGLYSAKTALGAAEKVWEGVKLGIRHFKINTIRDEVLWEKLYHMYEQSEMIQGKTIGTVLGMGMTMVTSPRSVYEAAIAPLLTSRIMAGFPKDVTFATAKAVSDEAQAWIDYADKMANYAVSLYEGVVGTWQKVRDLCSNSKTKASAVKTAVLALNEAHVAVANLIDEGQRLQREREAVRMRISNAATEMRYMDMYNRVQRNNALTKYSASYDIAQRYVWELAKVYDYETGALSADGAAGAAFLAEAVAARQLGEKGVVTSQATDKGLWDIVTRMKENWEVEKGRLGVNNPDTATKTFSLRYELFRIRPDEKGDAAWRQELAKYWVDDLKSNAEYVRYCQPLASSATATVVKEPGLVIPFATSINNAENFFGKTLQGGETQFSSADYVTKIHAVGVDFAGYDKLTTQTAGGLATEPNVYLVPTGTDYMRSPAGDRAVLGWSVVDQVMPLPYKVGSTQLDDESWIAGLDGTDGGSASGVTIRRHSTLRANGGTTSTRLVGRSVWNDRWLLVIPASSLNANRVQGLETFIKGVSDIKLAIKAYSRQGN